MEKEKKHVAYTETVKQIAASSWGRKYRSEGEAQRELLKDITLEGACLLGIIRRIDRVVSSLTSDENFDRIKRLKEHVDSSINDFVEQRESKHGKCPEIVLNYLQREADCAIGRQLMYKNEVPDPDQYIWFSPLPPKSKTKERREYDKWMRRKPKVEN